MPEVNAPVPGRFCWIELATSDPVAAKSFYTSVFKWDVNENDMGEMGTYTIFRRDERDCGAMCALMPEQKAQGIPPNWLSYIAVESADETVAKAKELGAAALHSPFDVMDLGRMAVLQDPQGAVFAVWEAKKHWGVAIRDESNTLCWNELATTDAGASIDFYTRLMGWAAKPSPEYTEWYCDGKAIGGMRTMHEGEPTPPNWMPYFMVDDCDAATAAVHAGGGMTCLPPTDMASVGRFSVVGDSQGAVFALFKPA